MNACCIRFHLDYILLPNVDHDDVAYMITVYRPHSRLNAYLSWLRLALYASLLFLVGVCVMLLN